MPSKPVKTQKFGFSYIPNSPMQKRLSEVLAAGKAKVILLNCGIRGGKTTSAIAELIKQHYVYHKKPKLAWVVSPTFPMSTAPENKFVELCQSKEGSLILAKRASERAYYLRPTKDAPNQPFKVEFKTATEPDRLRGFSVGFVIMDEGAQMSQEVFQILQGRVMDNDGTIIIPTTPNGKNWVYHDVYLRSLDDDRYVVINGRTDDNTSLPPDVVKTLREDWARKGERLAAQELDAQFVDFKGRVFDHFTSASHVFDERDIPADLPVYCGIDWGYNDPFVCVWCVKWDGVWIVVDEYYKTRGLLKEHANRILQHPLHSRVKRYWADPSGLQNRREFREMGITTLPARRPDKETGPRWPAVRARLMNKLFAIRKTAPWDQQRSVPGLLFFDTVQNGKKEFETLCYDRTVEITDQGPKVFDRDGQAVDNKNATERLEDRNNHVIDSLGYCLFSEERVAMPAPFVSGEAKLGKEVKDTRTKEELHKEEMAHLLRPKDIFKKKPRNYVDPFDTLSGLT